MAYTHTAFLGFVLQGSSAGSQWHSPCRSPHNEFRIRKSAARTVTYLERIMNRWRAAQVATVSFGALGLVLVASLTWNLPLSSPWIQASHLGKPGTPLIHLTMVTVKVTQALNAHPGPERTNHERIETSRRTVRGPLSWKKPSCHDKAGARIAAVLATRSWQLTPLPSSATDSYRTRTAPAIRH